MEPGRPLIESANHRNERQRRIRCLFLGIAALQGPRRESLMLVRLEKENTVTSPPLPLPVTSYPPLVSRLKNVSNFTYASVFLHKHKALGSIFVENVVEKYRRVSWHLPPSTMPCTINCHSLIWIKSNDGLWSIHDGSKIKLIFKILLAFFLLVYLQLN